MRHSYALPLVLTALFLASATAFGGGQCVEIRNGYFWDPLTTNYWVPHGFGYQTINGNVFANQNAAQLDYDMTEMRKIHADSLRVDFTWGNIETNDNQFDWSMTDHIVAEAEALGFRLFPLIGYQYSPTWSATSWKAVNVSNQTTALLNYESPLARAAYTDFLARITARYKDSKAIAGWILGNEYAYFDLWEVNDPHLFVGYDTNYSLPSFRAYLTNLYANSISALNANWGTSYATFSDVLMPTNYPGWNDPYNTSLQNRYYPAYHDLIQWRKQSIGNFVAIGSVAVKNADTNHLRSYSMVGGIYSGLDANNTCEDAKTIVARCLAAGAGLDFWSINNYAWALENNELRTAQFGITKYQDQSDLPVLVTETGHSSTDNLFPGASPRQPQALPGQVWEALMAGAIGVHIFTWNDRPMPQLREQGFGIIQTNRLIKSPVYWNILETFRRMEQVNVNNLFGATRNPPSDINFYWSSDADMVWGRANQENCMLWGGLKRLGYEPGFIDEDDLAVRAYTNARTLLLSHAFMMQSNSVSALTNVIAAGVNVHANAALPGRYNPYHKENAGWAAVISNIFGLTVSSATNTWHGGISGAWYQPYSAIQQVYDTTLAPLSNGYPWTHTVTWIKMQSISANAGTTVVHSTEGTGYPTLQIMGHGAQGRAAINTWTLGDTTTGGDGWLVSPYSDHMVWQLHYDWNRAIYRTWFGMMPQVDISGSGYFYVVPDYRTCTNGSVLISLLNESSNAVSISVTATNLMKGKTVERLSSANGVMETNSDGVVSLTLAGDEYVLLYAYTNNESLVNPNPAKIWIVSEPSGIWPNGRTVSTKVGYDTRGQTLDLYLSLESTSPTATERVRTNVFSVSGVGTNDLLLVTPDANLSDSNYVSSADGGKFILQAWLQNGGTVVSKCRLSTRLAWGAKPTSIPSSVTTGQTYNVMVNWQELPSYLSSEYPTPLSRATLWQTGLISNQVYTVFVDVMTGSVAIASSNFITAAGSGSNQFSVTVPGIAATQYWWRARTVSGYQVITVTSNNHDVVDGFEDRGRGDGAEFISPWTAFTYDQYGQFTLWARGVDANASVGTNAAFVIGNNQNPGGWSGFGMVREWSTAWPLPEPKSQWSNIYFAFDFRETNVRAGTLTMKLEDASGAIEFTTNYSGGGWLTISSRLDKFMTSAYPGTFDSNNVKKLTVLLQSGTQTGVYFSSFDNIRFVGTPTTVTTNGGGGGTGDTGNDFTDDFEGRTRGEFGSPSPWSLGSFGTGGQIYQNFGYDGIASHGTNGCWQVFWSHTNALGTSAYYMAYTYASSFALPTNLAQVGFSFAFYEKDNRSAKLEMQVKDSAGGYNNYVTNSSGAGPWDTIRANLNQFTGTLNPNDVKELDILVWMLQVNTQYVGHIDNVQFTGTVSGASGPFTNGLYLSIDDNSSQTDTDGDGIPDIYETNTGIYNGPTDTGTNPNDPDSDADGLNDGDEVIAGTNPNSASSVFTLDQLLSSTGSGMLVEWFARTGKVYAIHYLDGSLVTNSFNPLGSWTNIVVASDGVTNIQDTTSNGITNRFYRISVRRAP